jgi:hypothetical protein
MGNETGAAVSRSTGPPSADDIAPVRAASRLVAVLLVAYRGFSSPSWGANTVLLDRARDTEHHTERGNLYRRALEPPAGSRPTGRSPGKLGARDRNRGLVDGKPQAAPRALPIAGVSNSSRTIGPVGVTISVFVSSNLCQTIGDLLMLLGDGLERRFERRICGAFRQSAKAHCIHSVIGFCRHLVVAIPN